MNIKFVATMAVVAPDPSRSRGLYVDALGLPLEGEDGGYLHSETIPGCKSFGIWPLSQAAQACFGHSQWPADRPVPQVSIEFDVSSAHAVVDAVAELAEAGHDSIRLARNRGARQLPGCSHLRVRLSASPTRPYYTTEGHAALERIAAPRSRCHTAARRATARGSLPTQEPLSQRCGECLRLIELDEMSRFPDDGELSAGNELLQAKGPVHGDPRIILAPHHQDRYVDDGVQTLDLVRVSLVGLGDLAVERCLPHIVEPVAGQRTQGTWRQSSVAGTGDVGPKRTLMNRRRQCSEDLGVIAHETEEVRTPRSQSNHVDECQRREPTVVQQVRAKGHGAADVVRHHVW